MTQTYQTDEGEGIPQDAVDVHRDRVELAEHAKAKPNQSAHRGVFEPFRPLACTHFSDTPSLLVLSQRLQILSTLAAASHKQVHATVDKE